MKLEYNKVKDLLQEIRGLEFEMEKLPKNLIKDTYAYWYNVTLNNVSASMADGGVRNIDHFLTGYFDTCYRMGRYKRRIAELEESGYQEETGCQE